MAIIVKTYNFIKNATADASEVNKVFDDIYTEFNGNINSANIINTYSIAASQVGINDTAGYYSSTSVEGALAEPTSLIRGINTIHIMPQGSNGLVVFSGLLEVGGKLCKVTTNISNSGINTTSSPTNMSEGQVMYLACSQPTSTEICADNLSFVTSGVTFSSCYSLSQAGYYYNNKRLFAAVYCASNAVAGNTAKTLYDAYNPDSPSNPFKKTLTEVEACALGFVNIGITNAITVTGTYLSSICRCFNKTFGTYTYNLIVTATTSTNSDNILNLTPIPNSPMRYVTNQAGEGVPFGFFSVCATAIIFRATASAAVKRTIFVDLMAFDASSGGNA